MSGTIPASVGDPFISLVVEAWRFARVYARAVSRLDATEQGKYLAQHRYFLRQVELALQAVELRIVAFDGQAFDPGLPITAVNLPDFGPEERLLIEQTLEPTVLGPGGVVRMGSVTLRRSD